MTAIKHYPKTALFMVTISALFYLYEFFIRVSTSVLIEPMMQHFSVHATAFGAMSACFFWAYMPMQIPAGLLGDRFGPKRVLVSAVILCALATWLFASTESILWAGFSRLLIGFTASFAYIGPLMIAARWLKPKWFAMSSGFIQILGCMGAILGGAPIALVAQSATWQQAYLYAAGFGGVLALILLLFLKETPPGMPTYEAQSNTTKPCKSFDLSMLKNPQVLYTALIGFALWAPISVFAELWGIPFIMQAKHLGNVDAAYCIRWIWLGIAIGGPFMGWLSDKLERRKTPIVLACLIALLADGLLIYTGPPENTLLNNVSLLLFGISAATQCVTFGLVRDLNSLDSVGTGIGFNNMAVILGGTLLQPLSGWILERFGDGGLAHGIHIYSVYSYRMAFAVLPLLTLLGLGITLWLLEETHCQSQEA